MISDFYLFGYSGESLAEAASSAGELLGIQLVEHDSNYLGGIYWGWGGTGGRKVTVQLNFEDDEGFLLEPDFPQIGCLAYVSCLEKEAVALMIASGQWSCLRLESM